MLNLKQIYDEVIARITDSETEWKEFLSFYSRLYKYSFESATLIYAQRPDATMVADMETWNRKVGRWVNTGAKSIRVFDSGEHNLQNPYPGTRYLFDVKDTNGNPETMPKVWNINPATSQRVADSLNSYYLGENVPLEIVIGIMAESKAVILYNELMHGFNEDLKGTELQELPAAGVEDCFRQALVNSIIYLVGKRSGVASEALNEFNLDVIRYFKSKKLVARLGSGITRISQEILREIEASIKQIVNEKRSVKKDESSSGIELQRERRDTISRASELQQQRSRRNATGQVRTDGPVLPEGESSAQVHIPSDGRRAVADDAQSERGSTHASEQYNGANAEKQSGIHGEQWSEAKRPADTGSERHISELPVQDAVDGDSRGNNSERDSIQTEIKKTETDELQTSGSFFSATPLIQHRQQSLLDILEQQSQVQQQVDASPDISEKDNKTIIEVESGDAVSDTQNLINYKYSIEDGIGLGGLKTKFKSNIEAIKTLKVIESENRRSTAEEQRILVRYIGWGGMPQAFNQDASGWEKEYAELKELLTPEEYESARASTPNAHYTSPVVIEAIFKALDAFGFEKGNILEPSMGTGLFYSLLPESMKNSKLYGVELDSISGRISKQLYQSADIRIQGFETVDYPDNFFDIAVGNVPFGDYKLHDRKYDKYNLNIHDYFFAKALDKIRPGGIIAFITSKGTLDKENAAVRKYIAERADLIGAIRLPNTAFKQIANTDVTSDIIFLRKRERLAVNEADWLHLGLTNILHQFPFSPCLSFIPMVA